MIQDKEEHLFYLNLNVLVECIVTISDVDVCQKLILGYSTKKKLTLIDKEIAQYV